MKEQHTGQIIVFDGPDGIGKSTQLELSAEYLREQGYDVHTTRASGGTPIGEELRKASLSPVPRLPQTDTFISLAMHSELGFDLQKRKKEGQICLVDRSPLAIVAYNVFGSELRDKNFGFKACEKMLQLWSPDLLLVFSASQKILDERRNIRNKSDTAQKRDYFEQKPRSYHLRVQEGYKVGTALAEKQKLAGQVVKVDAEGSIKSIQTKVQLYINNLVAQ